MVHDIGEGNGEFRVTRIQRLALVRHVGRNVPRHSVGIDRRNDHSGRVEGLPFRIRRLCRLLGNLKALDGASVGHQPRRVVLEVDRAVLVGDGTANGILRLIARGGEQGVGRRAAALGGDVIRRCLSGSVPQNPQLAGGHVVEEIDIHTAAFLLIGRRQQTAGLGIALGLHAVGNAPCAHVDHHDIVAGVRGKLSRAGNADVGSAVVDHRCGCTHGNAAHAVCQIHAPLARQLPVAGHLDGVERAALGGEIVSVGSGVINHRAADIRVQIVPAVQQLARGGIQEQQPGGLAGIAGCAVVRSHQQEIVGHVSACPVEAALAGIVPGGALAFSGLRRAFIGDGHADEIRVASFAVPEAGVEIAVFHRQRAVGLSAQRIRVNPERFQRGRVERLHRAAGQRHKDHAVGVNRRGDGEAGLVIHIRLCLDLAAYGVHAIDLVARVGDDIAVHQNRAAHGIRIKAHAQLVRPVQCAVLCRRGKRGICDAVVGLRAAEIRPLRRNRRVDGWVGRRLIQHPGDGRRTAVLRLGDGVGFRAVGDHQSADIVPGHGQGAGDGLVAVFCQRVAVAAALAQQIIPRVVRQLLYAGENIPQMQQRIRRFRLEGHCHRGRFQNVQGIDSGAVRSLVIFHRDRNGLGVDGAVQRDNRAAFGGHVRTVHLDAVAYVLFAVAGVILIAGKSQLQILRRHGDGHGIGLHTGGKALGSILFFQCRHSTVALGCHVFQRQRAVEAGYVILIKRNTVFFLCQPDGDRTRDGVPLHQQTIQLNAGSRAGGQFNSLFLPVVQAAAEYLIINCLNADVFLTACGPCIDCKLCVLIRYRVAVGRRSERSIGFQRIFGGRGGIYSVGHIRQPVAHSAEIHGDGAVGHFLKGEIVGDMIVGIPGRNVMIGLSGNQNVAIAVLGRGLPEGRIGHHHAVAVDHLNGHGALRQEGQSPALAGLNCQRIGTGIAVGGNRHRDDRLAGNVHRHAICRVLTVHRYGIAGFQRLPRDRHCRDRIQNLIGILHGIRREGDGSRLIHAALVLHLNGCQGGNAGKVHRVVLGIGVAVLALTGDAVDHGVARRPPCQHAVSAAGQGLERKRLFHPIAGACQGINGRQGRDLGQQAGIVLCVGVDRAGEGVQHRNRHFPVRPLPRLPLFVRESVVLVGFLAVASGNAEGVGDQPFRLGKLCRYRRGGADRDFACKPQPRLLDAEGIVALGQLQNTVAVVRPLLSVDVHCRDGNAGVVVVGIRRRAVCEANLIMLAGEGVFIVSDRIIQVRREGLGGLAVDAHEQVTGGVVFLFGGHLNVTALFLIVRHGGHQLFQSVAGLTVHILAETQIADGRRADGQIIAAVFVAAGKVARHAVDGRDHPGIQPHEGVSAGAQRLGSGLTCRIGNVLRRDDQLSAGLRHENKPVFRPERRHRQAADEQQRRKQKTRKALSQVLHTMFSP